MRVVQRGGYCFGVKGPIFYMVKLDASLSGSGEANVDGVSEVMRKIELDREER